jgi:DNA modification methylase
MSRATCYSSSEVRLLTGDARKVLAGLSDSGADCVVTSPPYYGLRDYGVPGQYGLEATPQEYVDHLRGVFGEVRRVLAADGTLWLNLGDCYVSGPAGRRRSSGLKGRPNAVTTPEGFGGKNGGSLPGKSLLGMPWRVSFALQEDGWLLRSCIIWHKPNGVPESVRDRPATRHEYLFLFAARPRYWFDLDAIRVPPEHRRALGRLMVTGGPESHHGGTVVTAGRRGGRAKYDADPAVWAGRPSGVNMRPGRRHGSVSPRGPNPGTVWSIPTRPLRQAHFAPFPVDLPLLAIAAGCPPWRCVICGVPAPTASAPSARPAVEQGCAHRARRAGHVLDPFSGASTTGVAALQLGRDYTGIDLNWVARNSVQVGPDLRGDGSMPWRFRMAQTLEAAMTTPMVASSPWMRW